MWNVYRTSGDLTRSCSTCAIVWNSRTAPTAVCRATSSSSRTRTRPSSRTLCPGWRRRPSQITAATTRPVWRRRRGRCTTNCGRGTPQQLEKYWRIWQLKPGTIPCFPSSSFTLSLPYPPTHFMPFSYITHFMSPVSPEPTIFNLVSSFFAAVAYDLLCGKHTWKHRKTYTNVSGNLRHYLPVQNSATAGGAAFHWCAKWLKGFLLRSAVVRTRPSCYVDVWM